MTTPEKVYARLKIASRRKNGLDPGRLRQIKSEMGINVNHDRVLEASYSWNITAVNVDVPMEEIARPKKSHEVVEKPETRMSTIGPVVDLEGGRMSDQDVKCPA